MSSSKRKNESLPTPFAEGKRRVNVVVETPKGCRNKFTYDHSTGRFMLKKVLPAGSTFPYDFGFIPHTVADDGDPIDVLLLMDESAYPGCVVTARLIGVLEAEQTEKQDTVRNDRLIAVAETAHDYGDLKSLRDLNSNLLKELEDFFIHYNATIGRKFKLLRTRGPKRARSLVVRSLRSRRPSKGNGTAK
jgi:inorganic pyrophosphatase